MTNEIQKVQPSIFQILTTGNIKDLNETQKQDYLKQLCDSLGLNPLTRPFQFMNLQGREILYATKDASEQLRYNHKISINKLEKVKMDGMYIVTAHASDPSGRNDIGTGAVYIEGLKGDNLVNALLKSETKAKRRVTLSICGLGTIDETELETIPNITPKKEAITKESGYVIDSKELTAEEVLEILKDKYNDDSSAEELAKWKKLNSKSLIKWGNDNPAYKEALLAPQVIETPKEEE